MENAQKCILAAEKDSRRRIMGLGRVLHWGPLVAIGDAFAHQWLDEIVHQILTWTVFEGIIKWVSLATVYCSTMWWPPAGSLGGLAFLSSFLFFAGSDFENNISLVIFDLNLLHCQEWQCIIFSLPWWMDQAIFHLDGNLRRFSILRISFFQVSLWRCCCWNTSICRAHQKSW